MADEKLILPDGTTTPTPKPLLVSVNPVLEIVSKSLASIAIALYASGFLIVSLHHAQFGFTETNPFRARILAAGAWFFFLIAIPVVTMSHYGWRVTWIRFGLILYPYYIGCVSIALLAQNFFNTNSPAPSSPKSFSPLKWVFVATSFIVFGVLYHLTQSKKVSRAVSAIASASLSVLAIVENSRDFVFRHYFDSTALTLWFFGIGVTVVLESKWRRSRREWATSAFMVLASLFIFGTYHYPHIKSSWGGGSPVEVTMYFSKDSVVKPSQSVSVDLVDETDAGFYIVGKDESKAIYVPRNTVSIVYFGNKGSDSKLLP